MQILAGRVAVNGGVVTDLGTKMNPRKDTLSLDGKQVSIPNANQIHWIMLNKPKNCLTSLRDTFNRRSVTELIPRANDLRLVPIGRMDRDDTGLLLMTNEVGWIHPLTHPSFILPKRYELVVRGRVDDAVLAAVQKSFAVPTNSSSKKTLLCSMRIKDIQDLQGLVVLDLYTEGSASQQIEEIIRQLNVELVSVKRTEYGSIELGSLRKGEWRELTSGEIALVKSSCRKNQLPPPPQKSFIAKTWTPKLSTQRPTTSSRRSSKRRQLP